MRNGRKILIETLTELAEKDDKVILIVGDVGFSFMEPFKEKFPKQFLNTGVMEQSMMGIAVGLANLGFKPYVYTMKNFIILRPFEQLRNDICYGNANVKLLGVGGSEAYRFLGMSHNLFGDEEERLLKDLPNLNTYPDEHYLYRAMPPEEVLKEFLLEEYNRVGPAYFAI